MRQASQATALIGVANAMEILTSDNAVRCFNELCRYDFVLEIMISDNAVRCFKELCRYDLVIKIMTSDNAVRCLNELCRYDLCWHDIDEGGVSG